MKESGGRSQESGVRSYRSQELQEFRSCRRRRRPSGLWIVINRPRCVKISTRIAGDLESVPVLATDVCILQHLTACVQSEAPKVRPDLNLGLSPAAARRPPDGAPGYRPIAPSAFK